MPRRALRHRTPSAAVGTLGQRRLSSLSLLPCPARSASSRPTARLRPLRRTEGCLTRTTPTRRSTRRGPAAGKLQCEEVSAVFPPLLRLRAECVRSRRVSPAQQPEVVQTRQVVSAWAWSSEGAAVRSRRVSGGTNRLRRPPLNRRSCFTKRRGNWSHFIWMGGGCVSV